MHDISGILRSNLNGSVSGRGCRATDHDWHGDLFTLKLLGNVHHLIETWCDQATQADNINAVLASSGHNLC